jgi:enoyl-CoA hydratase/carnithine racemase
VVDRDDVLETAMAYARDVAANVSPASMATIKEQLRRYQTTSLEEAVADSTELMRHSTNGPDFREGVDSYLEGRPPAFLPLGEGTSYPWMKRD